MSLPPPTVSSASAPETPPKAEAIHREVMAAPLLRLWRAALGPTDEAAPKEPAFVPSLPVLAPNRAPAPAAVPEEAVTPAETPPLRLEGNRNLAPVFEGAAQRTGIPAAALAAIVNAEAARNKDGSWNPASRNPRSSATGLTQFLSSSWISEAERPGTFLNRLARGNDWLNSLGQVRVEARRALLSLRLDANTAIEAAADYAKHNLSTLEKAGVEIGNNVGRVARLAYIAHHLGAGDAVRYLTGDLNPARAASLLAAQVGQKAAQRRVEATGDPVTAHRGWLERFVSSKISIGRFLG